MLLTSFNDFNGGCMNMVFLISMDLELLKSFIFVDINDDITNQVNIISVNIISHLYSDEALRHYERDYYPE